MSQTDHVKSATIGKCSTLAGWTGVPTISAVKLQIVDKV